MRAGVGMSERAIFLICLRCGFEQSVVDDGAPLVCPFDSGGCGRDESQTAFDWATMGLERPACLGAIAHRLFDPWPVASNREWWC